MVVNTKTCKPRAHRMHNTKYIQDVLDDFVVSHEFVTHN